MRNRKFVINSLLLFFIFFFFGCASTSHSKMMAEMTEEEKAAVYRWVKSVIMDSARPKGYEREYIKIEKPLKIDIDTFKEYPINLYLPKDVVIEDIENPPRLGKGSNSWYWNMSESEHTCTVTAQFVFENPKGEQYTTDSISFPLKLYAPSMGGLKDDISFVFNEKIPSQWNVDDLVEGTQREGFYVYRYYSSAKTEAQRIIATRKFKTMRAALKNSVLSYYGTEKLVAASWLCKKNENASSQTADFDLMYFDLIEQEYESGTYVHYYTLTPLSEKNTYLLEFEHSYYPASNSKNKVTEPVFFVVTDTAHFVMQREEYGKKVGHYWKSEGGNYASYWDSRDAYLFNHLEALILLVNTKKTQSILLKNGMTEEIPILQAEFIKKGSPLYGQEKNLVYYPFEDFKHIVEYADGSSEVYQEY